ncbi:MAG: FlgD immunoglobulin-like domain containing protein, partial [Chitinivibrionales bacterium]
SDWDKSNDPSFCNSSEFVENTHVFVVNSEGDTVYGEAPASSMNIAAPNAEIRVTPTPATDEDEVVHIVIDADEMVDNVRISVYNSVSEVVDQQSSSDVSDSYEFTWDLKDRNGDMVSSGNYVVIAELEFTNGGSRKIEKVFGIQK